MPKTRRRKIPITRSSASSSSSFSSRALIRGFHVLLKKQAQLRGLPHNEENVKALNNIDLEIEELGGLAAYQRMSSIGQGGDRGGGSEKVLISWLREMGMSCQSSKKLKLLEVGALKHNNFGSCASWIDVTPMDLRSRHPAILEQDFLLMDSETEHCAKWDIISLSLVVNFVPESKDRGRMLRMAHEMLSSEGLLFLVLPLPCIENSRYLTSQHLSSLMNAIGFIQMRERWKKHGKMAYWLYQKADRGEVIEAFQKKIILRTGNRNNFSILL